jgi:hypothetical protein
MNIAPVLVCERCHARRLHIFVGRRPQGRVPGELAYVDCIYACDACGAVRVWGNERREETAFGRRLAGPDLAHAVDVHGMRRRTCPACRGLALDCSECDGDGRIWVFAAPEPCGPECPIAAFEPPVSE